MLFPVSLQEVLLAHSKTASHCEPITVILAEVEAPELAALLGFIYTGSATVPRVRLEAFLCAAEALRLRLPPVPVVMTCDEQTDCKLEDLKDVKINPKYLQCDQYPSSDEYDWCRLRAKRSYDETFDRKESCNRVCPMDNNRTCVLKNSRDIREVDNSCRTTFDPGCPSVWPMSAGFSHDDTTIINDPSGIKDHGSMLSRTNEFIVRNPATVPDGEISFNAYQQQRDACIPPPDVSSAQRYGSMEHLERIKTGYERVREINCMTERLTDQEIRGRGSNDFCGRYMRDGCTFDSRMSSSLQRTTINNNKSFERSDYAQPGEDLSCGENCRWRPTIKRHVANRVTASPWRQIVRPHHSPKTRPVMAQCHADDVSTFNRHE